MVSINNKLKGLYIITDDKLTPNDSIYSQVEDALKGGATIVQLRDKSSSDEKIKEKAIKLQQLCKEYDALFVLNDKIDLACQLQCDGLHIGKSDHERFESIRKDFKGIIGVSCYGDVKLAKNFEDRCADYVAFGSFYQSPTKPNSNIVSLDVINEAKKELKVPVCAIGGITTSNLGEVLGYEPDMVSVINDIWSNSNIKTQCEIYSNKFVR